MVAPETLPTTSPASEPPVLEICSEPIASTTAASFARSAYNCRMLVDPAAFIAGLGGGGGGGGSATIFGAAARAAASASALAFKRSSPKNDSPRAAGASAAWRREGGG